MKKRIYLAKGNLEESDFKKIKTLLAKDFTASEIKYLLGWSKGLIYTVKSHSTFTDYKNRLVKTETNGVANKSVINDPEGIVILRDIINAITNINTRLGNMESKLQSKRKFF